MDYSLITSQPLKAFGRTITPEQIAYFADRQLWALVDELASLKSDGIKGRTERHAEIASSPPGHVLADEAVAPLSLHIVRCWCAPLGIDVRPASRDKHVVLELSPLTSDMVRQMSCGAITRSDTINYRTRKPMPGGLLCPIIYPDRQAELFNWAYVELGTAVFADMWTQLPGKTDSSQCRWTWDVLPILPLAFRPLVELDDGGYATHDINDLYRQLVNRANRYKKLRELSAPEKVVIGEQATLQSELLHAQANRYYAKRDAKLTNGVRLTCAVDMLLDFILEPYTKRVEWSGVSKALVNSQLEASHVVVPAELFEQLRLSEELPIWLCAPQSARLCAAMPRRGGETCELSSALAGRMSFADESELEIHRPITLAGQRETLSMLELGAAADKVTDSIPLTIQVDGWQEDDGERKLLQRMVAIAHDRGSISLRSGTGYLIGGSGRALE